MAWLSERWNEQAKADMIQKTKDRMKTKGEFLKWLQTSKLSQIIDRFNQGPRKACWITGTEQLVLRHPKWSFTTFMELLLTYS